MTALAAFKIAIVADLGMLGKMPGVAKAIEKVIRLAVKHFAPNAMPILLLADQFAHEGVNMLPEPSRVLLDELLQVFDEALAIQPAGPLPPAPPAA